MTGSKTAGATLVVLLGLLGGVAMAGMRVDINPHKGAELECDGGMSNHGHQFYEGMVVFEGDPEVTVERTDVFYEEDGEEFFSFRLEEVTTGTHAGTHIDVPSHFIEEGARSIDDLYAEEFVWPVYVIDVRSLRTDGNEDFQLSSDQIRAYEKHYGKIQKGSLVVIQTGQEELFDDADNAFLGANPGLSGEAVQWMFDHRHIAGTGSDAYGPDASSDELFDATYTTLLNDGVAVVALDNLDDLAIEGDILMAPAVRLEDGSGFPVNPISCQGKTSPRQAGAVPASAFDR